MRLDPNWDIEYDEDILDISEEQENKSLPNSFMDAKTKIYIWLVITWVALWFWVTYILQDHWIQNNITIIQDSRKNSDKINLEIKDLYFEISEKKKLIDVNIKKATESKKELLEKYGIIFK